MLSLNISSSLDETHIETKREIKNASRSIASGHGKELIIDSFDTGVECLSIRIEGGQSIELTCETSYSFQQIPSGGYLGTPLDSGHALLWLPMPPAIRTTNPNQQILFEQQADIFGFSWSNKNIASLQLRAPKGTVLDLVVWRFPSSFSINQLVNLSAVETQGYFLWGSHGRLDRPADLYRHLIHGGIYDLRYSWPDKKKCFSENEAHALYTIFSGLEKSTGKPFYRLLQLQIVLSLIHRQSKDGGWYHGIWTDDRECHYRLHTSAVHLLMDELQRSGCPGVKSALVKAATFLSKTTDQLDCGTWFLHDSLELNEQAMNSGPFKWIQNRSLGKRVSNMLVLNTHLDTSIALNRYGRVTGDKQYQDLVDSATNSTRAVLSLTTADWLYKPLFQAIGLTILPTKKASRLPLPARAVKRLAWQYLIRILPDIKARFPRLVMPNGYIDRELSLRTWAIDYQTINLMDLARYARAFPGMLDESILDKSLEFTQTSGLIKRYRELAPGKRYAVGFWVEALYHRCLAKKDLNYRKWLAEAILECQDLEFGIPPSLLGSNGEAHSYNEQEPCPVVKNSEVVVANLSSRAHSEYLLVNCAEHAVEVYWHTAPFRNIEWRDTDMKRVSSTDLTINGRKWLIGIYEN